MLDTIMILTLLTCTLLSSVSYRSLNSSDIKIYVIEGEEKNLEYEGLCSTMQAYLIMIKNKSNYFWTLQEHEAHFRKLYQQFFSCTIHPLFLVQSCCEHHLN